MQLSMGVTGATTSTLRWIVTAFLATQLASITRLAGCESIFTRHEKPNCPERCTQFGNCNGDTGQCECQFGYEGPTCEDRVMPACHTSLTKYSVPMYGTWTIKNCNCYRQLARIGCPDVGDRECLYEALWNVTLTCFEVMGMPPEIQTSDLPPGGFADPSLEWYHGQPLLGREAMNRTDPPLHHKMPDQQFQLPLSACPDRCNERGICSGETPVSARGSCVCMTSYEGRACEKPVQEDCYLSCSGGARAGQPNGTCIQGFCHCPPGRWGLGCSRDTYYTSSKGWQPSHAGLRIFVYNLPQNVVHRKTDDGRFWADFMYLAEEAFMSQLLEELVSERGAAGDSYVTQNPWEANLFLVPSWSYYYTGNVVGPLRLFRHIIKHLRSSYPFWEAQGGRNHIMWATNDRGVCDWQHLEASLKHPIIMTHFGQSPRIPIFHPLRPEEALEVLKLHSDTVFRAMARPMFRGFLPYNHLQLYHEHTPCYRPEKDVVVPPIIPGWAMEITNQTYERVDGGLRLNRSRPRPLTFVFTGSSRMEDMAYSQGVRQSLLYMSVVAKEFQTAWKRPDFLFKPAGPDRLLMADSKYCLAPSGWGWGVRLAEAMVVGCVPVIVQDHVYQRTPRGVGSLDCWIRAASAVPCGGAPLSRGKPQHLNPITASAPAYGLLPILFLFVFPGRRCGQFLWDVLPYDEFSVRISRRDFHRLPEILDGISETELRRLQDGLARWRSAFVYRKYDKYGKAYEYILEALRRRLLHLRSVNF